MKSFYRRILLAIVCGLAGSAYSLPNVQISRAYSFKQNDKIVNLTNGSKDPSGEYKKFGIRFPAAGGALELMWFGNPVDLARPGDVFVANLDSTAGGTGQIASSNWTTVP